MPKLDLKRLKADVGQHAKARAADPARRRLTGAMAIVRDNLQEIEALKAGGNSWVAIAAGLAEQGVTQGDHQPLTAKRLTALIASVKRQAALRAVKAEARDQRRDLRPQRSQKSPEVPLRLSNELTRLQQETAPAASMTEEEIRLANFDKHSAIFRKDHS